MPAKLVVEEGTLKGLTLALEGGEQWIIGRDPDACQLLVEDPSTSRTHILCKLTTDGIEVSNLSTTNPSQINNEELKEPRLLQNGDHVKIGDNIFCFFDGVNMTSSNLVNIDEGPLPLVETTTVIDPEEVSEGEIQKVEELPEKAQELPQQEIPQQELFQDDTPKHSIFEEDSPEKLDLAKITFSFLDTGRWLLKVISGPNNGAEFSLQTGSTYVIGTDPNACDLVFYDTSVSRQHVRITITPNETITIEDLRSRNGTTIDGSLLKEKQTISPNSVIGIGTSSFVIYDREGEMKTIISPLMPAIVKSLTQEPVAIQEKEQAEIVEEKKSLLNEGESTKAPDPHHHTMTLGVFILIGILTGIFIVVGIGISTLFKGEPIVIEKSVDTTKALDAALLPFAPNVKYTFNKDTGQLLLIGHVLVGTDRSQILYALQGLSFIKNLDESGLIIDEGVWREFNQVLEKNPEWKGINIMAPSAGHFVVSGYLQKRAQADTLLEYLNANFPYPELLDRRIVVDEEVVGSVNNLLQTHGYKSVNVALDNGEITLTGVISTGKTQEFNLLVPQIKEIRGVRGVRNYTTEAAHDESIINVSDKYEVTGSSSLGGKLSVIINGRILTVGDSLDGMTILSIRANVIMLTKDGVQYRIDFTK